MSDDGFFIDANRRLWNERAAIHAASKFYDVPGFKAGTSSLCGIENDQLGDIAGKSVLHLQCHFGLDTLSLARRGADVTGVDLSDASIAMARRLAKETSINARFVCCDVLDLPAHLNEQFDIVFSSFGTVGWLPDIRRWGEVVSHFVRPHGLFFFLEFHRMFIQLDKNGEIAYDYFYSAEPDEETTTTTYTDGPPHAPLKEYWWNHTMSDIFMALQRSGMRIDDFQEFPYSPFKLNENMIEIESNRWVHKTLGGKIPYMFSLKARHDKSI